MRFEPSRPTTRLRPTTSRQWAGSASTWAGKRTHTATKNPAESLPTAAMELLERIETYLDAVPLSAAEPEHVGKFILFRPLGPWPYYGRPRLGLDEPIGADDVAALRERQRELKLPENVEWVVETTPSLADAARDA